MVSGGKCDFPQVMKSNWCHFPVFPDQILGQLRAAGVKKRGMGSRKIRKRARAETKEKTSLLLDRFSLTTMRITLGQRSLGHQSTIVNTHHTQYSPCCQEVPRGKRWSEGKMTFMSRSSSDQQWPLCSQRRDPTQGHQCSPSPRPPSCWCWCQTLPRPPQNIIFIL